VFEEEDVEVTQTNKNTKLNRKNYILRKLPDMNDLKRARDIKETIKDNIAVLQPVGKTTGGRRQVKEDLENQLIKNLRQEENMNWCDIADLLNEERRQRGEAASFTEAAVYSRFVRNAPRIATAVGEIGFDPKDYMHLRHPNQYSTAQGTETSSKVGKKRVKNYENAKELEANMRKEIKEDELEELETVERTEQLMDAVAKVERNFWILVADEMERATTKLYPPNALANRYHSV
jgi:hypothetical protein